MTEQGYSVAEAARNLGVNPNLLRTWKQKLEADEEISHGGRSHGIGTVAGGEQAVCGWSVTS